MNELPPLSNRARRALPLIAAALTAIVVAGLLYLNASLRPSATPAGSAPIAIMSGPYSVTYDFINPSVGWALVLDYGSFSTGLSTSLRIFSTTDGAGHWQLQYTGRAEGGQTYIHFVDRRRGFAYAGVLYRTIDSGVHWETVDAPGMYTTFASPSRGWSLGVEQRMYSTPDGGMTWTRVADLPLAAILNPYGETFAAKFRDTGEGWLGAGYLESPVVYLTLDGAATWRAVALAPPSSPHNGGYLTTVAVAPGGQVVVLVSDETMLLGAYSSDDLGRSWLALAPPPALSTFADLTFVDATHWIALRAGFVYKTADAGMTWERIEVEGLPDDWRYLEARAIDAKHGWWAMLGTARSMDSALAMTSDGGRHWKTVNVPKPT